MKKSSAPNRRLCARGVYYYYTYIRLAGTERPRKRTRAIREWVSAVWCVGMSVSHTACGDGVHDALTRTHEAESMRTHTHTHSKSREPLERTGPGERALKSRARGCGISDNRHRWMSPFACAFGVCVWMCDARTRASHVLDCVCSLSVCARGISINI